MTKPPLPSFSSRLHDERTASLIGTALGVAFATAFATGLVSHVLQHPPGWLAGHLPTRPSWGYRLTQGLHVSSGIAAIPLLFAKLWTVYPKLFEWPPLKSLAHALERLSILVLLSGAMFELVTGLLNAAQWYPWKFPFIQTHYWVAWITVGALILHVGVKAPAIARGYRRADPAPGEDALASGRESTFPSESTSSSPLPSALPSAAETPPHQSGVSRRAFIATTAVATGTVTLATVGQSVNTLQPVSVLSPRDVSVGPQHLPVNRTAVQAGVTETARHPDWTLEIDGPDPKVFSMDQLLALPQTEVRLPIACVEGWSVDAHWSGVRIRTLLDMVGAPAHADLRVHSLEEHGAYNSSVMEREYASDPLAILALRLNGETLALDHGYPARVMVPNRPGVLQTKWVRRLEVLA